MRVSVTLEGLDKALTREFERVSKVQADAIKGGADGLKNELREMTRGPLGPKVAFAWQSEFYPEDKTGFVYTKTPKIIDSNMRGGTITAVGGGRYMAIPSDNVPRFGRYGRKMTPEEVERKYNQDLILHPGKTRKTILAFIELKSGRRRAATSFRGASQKTRRGGRSAERILMFTFTKSVRGRKVIDPDAAFRRWSDRTQRTLEQELA